MADIQIKSKGPPLDINLPPSRLKKAIQAAFEDVENYGVFDKKTKKFTGEMEVTVGDAVSVKWDPVLREGYIDVEGVPGKGMDDLFGDFDKVRQGLPPGKYGLHPGEAKNAKGEVVAKKAVKHKLYKRRFRHDPQITLKEDLQLRNLPGGSQESFILDTNDYSDELLLSKRNKQGILETPKPKPQPKPSQSLLDRAAALKKQQAIKSAKAAVKSKYNPTGLVGTAVAGGQAAIELTRGRPIHAAGRAVEAVTDLIPATRPASVVLGRTLDQL